jgi:tRNA A37 threonylcarbamoyladenosine biosynthesis protein TsaE
MARAFGVDPKAVHSPSFLLMHDYGGMIHIDCYRLQNAGWDALVEAGLWEAMEGAGVKAVEWPPPDVKRRIRKAFRVRLRFAEGNHRIIELPEIA